MRVSPSAASRTAGERHADADVGVDLLERRAQRGEVEGAEFLAGAHARPIRGGIRLVAGLAEAPPVGR